MDPIETVIMRHKRQERERRNAELRKMLECAPSMEEILAELSALKGFNVEERARVCV